MTCVHPQGTEAGDGCWARPRAGARLDPRLDTPHSCLGGVTSPSTSGSRHGTWSPGHTQQRGRLPSGPLLPTPASSSQVRVPVPGRHAALGRPDPHRATGHASHGQRRSVPAPLRPASCELLNGHPAHPSTCPQQQQATQPSGHRTESPPGPGADISEPRGATAWNSKGCSHPIATPPLTPGPRPLLDKAPQPGPGPQWGLPLTPSHTHPAPGGGRGQAAAPRLT